MSRFGSFVRGKIFEMLFLTIGFLSIFYVANRLDLLICAMFNINIKWIIIGILVIILGYMLLYIKCGNKLKNTRNIYEICGVIVCFILHLIILLWVYDFISLFINIDNIYYIVVVILAIMITIYGFINAKNIMIKKYNIDLGINKKIILISDIHIGTFVNHKQLSKIVEKINKQSGDIIIIAGDLFDVDAYDYCDLEKISNILNGLQCPQIYAVLGNHDPSSLSNKMIDFYAKTNIKLLIDEKVDVGDIVLVGRDDITTNPNRLSLHKIIGNENKTVIVVDHNPLGVDEALENNINLIMCGHTHKGQFFPANIFTKLAYGKEGYYGCHKKDNMNIVVSSGVGYFQMPMRIFSNSEIVLLECYKA